MIRSLYCTSEGRVRADLSVEEFVAALQDPEGVLWVDFSDEPRDTCEPILRQTFGFHPLAIDDALEESHVPKIDDWGQYVYLDMEITAASPCLVVVTGHGYRPIDK